MILSGKCADRFKEWLTTQRYSPYGKLQVCVNGFVIDFDVLHELFQYALIIDFMDSEGIFIHAKNESMWSANSWSFMVDTKYTGHSMGGFPSRTEALKAAIEKANNLINTKNQ